MTEFLIVCCGGTGLLIALIYLPIFLINKGFDMIRGCFGNVSVVIMAIVLLMIYLNSTNTDVCQIWLVGEYVCTLWHEIGIAP